MVEKTLKYSRAAVGAYDGVAQQKPWDCGPASVQVILHAAGVERSEDWLIGQINAGLKPSEWVDTAGTDHAGLLCPILNALLPGSGYKAVWLPSQPVSKAQVEQLWTDVTRSIDAGRGVVLNFEAPPSNLPRASYTSTVSPSYPQRSTTYHYVAGMGYATDSQGGRHIWIADPGFSPFGYWCSLEQVAKLIVPHAYAFAATAPIPTPPPAPAPAPAPEPPAPAPDPKPILDPVAVITQPDWDEVWRTNIEWQAIEFGDLSAVEKILRAAQSGDARAVRALVKLEEVNPAVLQQFTATITATEG